MPTTSVIDAVLNQHMGSKKNAQFASRQTTLALEKDFALLQDRKYHNQRLDAIRQKQGYIIDMEGVIYDGGHRLLPGAKQFVDFLHTNNKRFFFLTNNSGASPSELKQKLAGLGIDVTEDHFFTSGMATAEFLHSQMPEGGSCYVIGEPCLGDALTAKGFTIDQRNPDYVILGETSTYDYDSLTTAVQLVMQGAKLIATNPDIESLDASGKRVPSCGTFVVIVEEITKTKAFFCGKPSALPMRYAQRVLGTKRENTCIIGDRMDTDIVAGISSEIDSVLVLSGVTAMEDLAPFAYRPYLVLSGVGEIPDSSY
ncbi:N-acetylglucosamine-6-phosphate deacetylase [Fennellomyces sp. T-0311]|nr:N-acetylglucosamine-6-phosphate deacetylase [Fennellomyces sp. T-0311]